MLSFLLWFGIGFGCTIMGWLAGYAIGRLRGRQQEQSECLHTCLSIQGLAAQQANDAYSRLRGGNPCEFESAQVLKGQILGAAGCALAISRRGTPPGV